MKRPAAALWLVALVLSATAVASSQVASLSQTLSPPNEPATAVIVGTVVDGSTRKPVGSVTVSLIVSSTLPGVVDVARPGSVLTGSDGRFVFTSLKPGRYALSTSKTGYLPASFNAARPLASGGSFELTTGEHRTDLTLYAWKSATIGGTILDEAGEPAIGIEVRFVRRSVSNGRTLWNATGTSTVRTDDRGMYRAAGITPGDYIAYVPVTQTTVPTSVTEEYQKSVESRSPSMQQLMTEMVGTGAFVGGSTPGQAGVRQSGDLTSSSPEGTVLPTSVAAFAYPTTFYPAGATIASATAITLGSGDERSDINFQLRPVRAIAVSGSVQTAEGPLGLTRVALIPRTSGGLYTDFEVAATVTDAGGTFSLLNVPEGQYTLRVTRVPRALNIGAPVTSVVQTGSGAMSMTMSTLTPTVGVPLPPDPVLWAEMPIVADRDDIRGLLVMARHGIKVQGRVEFVGGLTKPTEREIGTISSRLIRVDGRPSGGGVVRVSPTGELNSQGFTPGRYLVAVDPPVGVAGWTLESVMHEGADISQVPLELSNSDVTDLVVTFTDRRSELAGIARDANGAVEPSTLIVVSPAEPTSATDDAPNLRRQRSTRANALGRFSFSALPPGDYLVMAVPAANEDRWADATVLQSLRAQATRVKVAYGLPASVDVVVRKERQP